MNFLSRIISGPRVYQVAFSRATIVRSGLPSVSLSDGARFSTKTTKLDVAGGNETGRKTAGPESSGSARKAKTSPKVTLIGQDESISIVNLEEATKISNRRNLKLVKVTDLDSKTQRPVYRLMTGSEYLTEDLKRREEKKKSKQDATVKGDKLLTISARIAEHDLVSKIQNVQKWLTKSYEVRVVVTGDGAGSKGKQEDIAQRFETNVKECGKIVQKRLRDNDLRFNILPVAAGSAPSSATATTTAGTGTGKQKTLLETKGTNNPLAAGGDAQAVRGIHYQASGLLA
ncbi:translation initiation factor-3 [Anopheles darlingi]|uniref:Translation initiation factor-3 n=1 Tax=Anopheles darlingi TaxID=43151 RepID=W5J4K6_ANODA|nr:translation initiation factor-3 [Anopheles darlingi]